MIFLVNTSRNIVAFRWSLFLLVPALLFSCVSSNQRDDGIFHYNQPNTITSLDPAFARNMTNMLVTHHLYSKLVKTNEDLDVVGDLARSWEIDSTGTRYTFYLHGNRSFHQYGVGASIQRPVNAWDVQYSFNRILSDDVSSPGSWVFKDRVADEDPFIAQDDSTFILQLKEPFAAMLSILTMEYCSVVCPEAVEFYGDQWRRNPVGTGPYEFVNWAENDGLFLKKSASFPFPEDFNGPEGIRVSFMRDRRTALIELITGNLDMLYGYDPSYRALIFDHNNDLLDRIDQTVILQKAPFLNTEYLGINLKLADSLHHPLSDRHLRKALNFALDRAQMLKTLNGGVGRPAHQGFIPYGLPAFDSNQQGYSFNLDSVQYHLERSEYHGQSITLYTNKDYLEKCLFASRAWNEYGIKVQVDVLESSVLRDRMRHNEVVFFRGSWIADYPDAENFLVVFQSQVGAPPNYTRFQNENFDNLYHQASKTTSREKRHHLYRKANQIIIDESPVIFLYYDESFVLSSKSWNLGSIPPTQLLEVERFTSRY